MMAMDREKAYVLWFDELRREDVALVGGKSSSLGELTSQTDVPVPYGFATTAAGYRHFMHETGMDVKIPELLKGLTDVEDAVQLRDVTAKIRQAICDVQMPDDLAEEIRKSYEELARKSAKPSLLLPFAPALRQKTCPMPALPVSRIRTSMYKVPTWSSKK